uniref:Uncharacterized protein n=1 Tax=Avena sativa TaxID=4498 RepID=A0ACD5XUG1_AVESA
MPSLKHHFSSVIVLDFASKMKIGNLKKVATLCKSKTIVLTARLLVLASLRRRIATVGAVSHGIHTLMAGADQRVDCDKAIVPCKGSANPAVHHGHTVDISNQLALFHQEDGDGGCANWTLHSIFDDDNCCYINDGDDDDDDDAGDDDHSVPDVCDDDHSEDEPSVMDVIRSNREVEGLEFNVEDEIDQAADMFITRFRIRMSRSCSDLASL